jgi:adenylate cyclase
LAEAHVDRRLAAILAADVAGYSRLMSADEEGTLRALTAHRRELVDPTVAAHRGRIVKTTGDGVLVEFASVVDAVRCAVTIQREMAQRNREVPPDKRIEFRVGINVGDIIIQDGDVFGDGVNIAARLEGIAPPGGITISRAVQEQLGHRVDVSWRARGLQSLKNIASPVEVFEAADLASSATAKPPTARRRVWPIASGGAAVLACAVLAWMYWPAATKLDGSGRAPGVALQSQMETDRPDARPIVAVLPFANLSGDPTQEYFSDGISEDLISALGRFRGLMVMAWNAVMPLKGKPEPVAEIGKQLRAQYLVSGSVRRSGERVRVTAQLTDMANGVVLWSDKFDEPTGDLFVMQDNIVRQIAGALASRVGLSERGRVLRKPTESLQAYDLVLRGRELQSRATRSDHAEARQAYLRAIALDPAFSDARVGLAETLFDYVERGYTDNPVELLGQAEEHARLAIAQDPANAAGYAMLGRVHVFFERYDEALAAINRALVINPSDESSLASRAEVLLWIGRPEEALATFETIRRINPVLSPHQVVIIGMAYLVLRQPEQAKIAVEETIGRYNSIYFHHVLLAIAHAELGSAEGLAREVAIVRRQNPFFDGSAFGTRLKDPAQRQIIAGGLRRAGLLNAPR